MSDDNKNLIIFLSRNKPLLWFLAVSLVLGLYWVLYHGGTVAVTVDGVTIQSDPAKVQAQSVDQSKFQYERLEIEDSLATKETRHVNRVLRSNFSINFWLLDNSDEPDDLTNYSIFYMVFDVRGDDADTMYWDGIWFYKRKDSKDNGQYSLYFKPKRSTKEDTMVKGGSFTCLKGSTGKGDSIWHNYTITYDQGKEQIRLFQNGMELTSKDQSIQGVKMGEYLDPSSQLVIGASPVVREKGYPWKGQWDDFRIYDFTLTKPQMKKIYKKQKPK